MAKKKVYDADFSKIASRIIKTPVEQFVEESYLPFAHYVIMNRALISDDGMKPVQRRILYAMSQLNLTDKKDHMKAAQIVGEVMGKYHPHGDSSISDALARMGQEFSLRVPLIDVYGSVGHTTGDVPAAPRYWEGRPTAAAMETLKDLKEGAIEMGLNYDGRFEEPSILPVRWPVGLINGSQGIAVGYASTIISHNPTEVMDACIYMVKNPNATVNDLLKIIKGPDMPTGGILVGMEGVKEYFETGRGTFAVRGKYTIEPGARGTHVIVFSEAPYQVSGESIIESIQKNKKDNNRLKEVSYAKELSDKKNGFRFSVGVKGGANPEVVLRDLFKYTPLEQKYSANTTILKDGVPKVTPIKDIIEGFLAFRCMCITNKANNKLSSLDKSIERLEGIIKVLVDIDKAIKIIRNAEDMVSANTQLQESFKINEEQSSFILSMPLRRLTKSDSIQINNEVEGLRDEKRQMELILSDESEFQKYLISELEETKKVIGDPRRTQISKKTEEDLKKEAAEIKKTAVAVNKNSECYVTLFNDGNIVRSDEPISQGKSPKGIISQVHTRTQENIVFISKDGSAMKIPTIFVPETEIDVNVTTGMNSEDVLGVTCETLGEENFGVLLVTSKAGVNIVNGKYPNSKEFQIAKLEADEELVSAVPLETKDYEEKDLVMISSDSYISRFPLNQVRTSNSGAGTVRGMNIGEDARIAGASITAAEGGEVVSCTYKTLKVTNLDDIPSRNRNAKGVILQKLQKDDIILSAFASDKVIASKSGKSIKLPDISPRSTVGVARSGTGVLLGYLEVK